MKKKATVQNNRGHFLYSRHDTRIQTRVHDLERRHQLVDNSEDCLLAFASDRLCKIAVAFIFDHIRIRPRVHYRLVANWRGCRLFTDVVLDNIILPKGDFYYERNI